MVKNAFIEDREDGSCVLTAPGVVLLLAEAAYNDDCEAGPAGQQRSLHVIREVLRGATQNGLTSAEVAEAILASDDFTRKAQMAQAVCSFLDTPDFMSALERAGVHLENVGG